MVVVVSGSIASEVMETDGSPATLLHLAPPSVLLNKPVSLPA